MLQLKSTKNLIAYFSMEVAIDNEIFTYAGGLGVLAGDTLRSFAGMDIPAVGVTLLSEYGYFKQKINSENKQVEYFERWAVERYLQKLDVEVVVQADNRDIYINVWQYLITGINKLQVPILFLDTNHPKNSNIHRKLTQKLYPANREMRLVQEIVLGIGGVRALKALGYKPSVFHLNEGHSSFLTLELYHELHKLGHPNPLHEINKRCVFTTHTPVPAGHDRFTERQLSDKLDFDYLVILEGLPEAFETVENESIKNYVEKHSNTKMKKKDGGPVKFLNMTRLALATCGKQNGVAQRHASVSRSMFPEYRFDAITNGIHHIYWTSPSMYMLFDEYMPNWDSDPFSLLGASNLPPERVERAHSENKARLIAFINQYYKRHFREDVFTIGYARRFTAYKRPDLIFYDLDRLKSIAQKHPIQLIFAGKAHPEDEVGQSLINDVISLSEKLGPDLKLVFLENYNLNMAKIMIPGVDLWLNTPKRPLEASGTSGMKASLNGVPNLSVLDGWWLEGCIEGVTGWSIGPNPVQTKNPDIACIDSDDAEAIYEKLEKIILPMYDNHRDQYSEIRRNAIALHGSLFTTYRMIYQYMIKSYLM